MPRDDFPPTSPKPQPGTAVSTHTHRLELDAVDEELCNGMEWHIREVVPKRLWPRGAPDTGLSRR